ncbi:MAG: hypothetical protein ACUVS4_15065 [Chloroflexaceae bacterium]
MLQCDVSDIYKELHEIKQRLARYHQDFAELVNCSPCLALSYLEWIAFQRARELHLTMLACGLSTDYDRWTQAPMDERMCQIGFRRISRRRSLYVRQTLSGFDLSDIFSTVHVELYDLDGLMASIRQ